MTYQTYSNEIDDYDLQEGYRLTRAQTEEFSKWWVVYRDVNEDFAQSFAETQKDLEGVPFCFWVELDHTRVAGVVMLPNGIGDFFLIPPESDAEKLLSIIMPLLEVWSDEQKPIGAQAIPAQYQNAFQAHGFVLQESRHWMIRPTAKIDVKLASEWQMKPLAPQSADEIAKLLEDAFKGGVGQYGRRDFAAHLASVEQFFENYDVDSPCGRASGAVYEQATSKLAAVNMVDLHKGLPTIRFVAVSPEFQRRGLATQLINHAINMVEPTYNWIKLAVTVDNSAVATYQKIGFIPSGILCQLIRPANK